MNKYVFSSSVDPREVHLCAIRGQHSPILMSFIERNQFKSLRESSDGDGGLGLTFYIGIINFTLKPKALLLLDFGEQCEWIKGNFY
jgi:hypothetical protein